MSAIRHAGRSDLGSSGAAADAGPQVRLPLETRGCKEAALFLTKQPTVLPRNVQGGR